MEDNYQLIKMHETLNLTWILKTLEKNVKNEKESASFRFKNKNNKKQGLFLITL